MLSPSSVPLSRSSSLDIYIPIGTRPYPHLMQYRLPPYSPQLQPIERLWRPLPQFATHNVLFDELTELLHALRSGLAYFRTQPKPCPILSALSGSRLNHPSRE